MAQRQRVSERSGAPRRGGVVRLGWTLAISLLASLCLHCTGAEPAREKPNVVLIMADDLGYTEVGYQGAPAGWTPNIDALAAGGTVFSDAYVAAPVCAPSRAALMTGRHPARYDYLRVTGTIEKQIAKDIGVDLDEVFLTELMRDAGYKTAVIGKWHLGYNEKYRPENRGVDYFFGFLAGGHDYYVWDDPSRRRSGGPILRNEEKAEGDGYLTEAFTDEAVGFIYENRARPFFLYLAYQNPHPPMQVPAEYLAADQNLRAGTIRALDRGVGAVLRALEEAGLERDTIVVFLNDNGGPDNGPLRGVKGSLYEGGIRVAMAIRWPGHIPPGVSYTRPVSAMDLLPTLVAAAGGELPSDRPLDGVDLLPYLRGERDGSPHALLFWQFYPRGNAVRRGSLKLHVRGATVELFDLSQDPGEENDIASDRPAAVRELRDAIRAWNRDVPKPRARSRRRE